MTVSATTEGNALGFRLHIIDAKEAEKTIRDFVDRVKRAQKEIRDSLQSVGAGGVGGGGGGGGSRGGGKSSADRDRERKIRDDDRLAKQMADGRERAEADRKRRQAQEDRRLDREARENKRRADRQEMIDARNATNEQRKRERDQIKVLTDRQRASSQYRQAMNDVAEATQAVTNATMQLARGMVYLGLTGEESTQKLIQGMLAANSIMDIGQGMGGLARGIGKYQRGVRMSRAAAAPGALRGMAGLLTGAPASAIATAGVAAAAGGGLGIASAMDFARGNQHGGVNDFIASNIHVPIASAIHERGGRFATGITDAVAYSMMNPALRGMLNVGSWASGMKLPSSSDWVAQGNSKEAIRKRQQMADLSLTRQGQDLVSSRSAMMRSQYNTVGSTFDDIRAGFMPEAFGLQSGSVGNLRDQMSRMGGRTDSLAQLKGLQGRIGEAQAGLRTAPGRQEEEQAQENIVALRREEQQILMQIASEQQGILRIATQEANVAKQRLQDSAVSLTTMNRGEQGKMLHFARKFATIDQLQGDARTAALNRLTTVDLNAMSSFGLEGTNKMVREASAANPITKRIMDLVGGSERSTVQEAEKVKQSSEAEIKAGLNAVGVGKANEKTSDILVKRLGEIEKMNIEMMGSIMEKKLKDLKAEIFQELQKMRGDKQKEGVAMRSNQQAQFVS